MSEPTTSTRLRDSVAEEIRVLLVRRRMTAVSLSRQLGWSQSYLAHRLTGRQPFDLDDLEAIAAALDVRVVDLFPAADRSSGPTRSYGAGTATAPRSPIEAAARPSAGRPPGRVDTGHPPPGHRRTAPVRP